MSASRNFGSSAPNLQHRFPPRTSQLSSADEELRTIQERLRLALECMGEGLFALDANGKVTLINPTACRILGYEAHELIGKVMHNTIHYKHLDGSPFPRSECAGLKVLTEAKTVEVLEDYFIRKDGSFVPVAYNSSPIVRGGDVIGAVVAFQDLSKRLEQENTLRKAQERLQLIHQAIGVGTWEWDVDSDHLVMSPEAGDMMGLDGVGPKKLAHLLGVTFVHEDGRNLRAAIRRTLKGKKEFRVKFRIRRGNSVACIFAAGKVFFNRGSATLLGILIDTTELKSV